MRTWSGLLALSAVVVGCSARIIDAGSSDGGTASAGSSSGSGAGSEASTGSGAGSSSGSSAGSASGSSAGSSSAGSVPLGPAWIYKGYIENFMFASGSDTVVMNLQFPADGTVTGNVYFGDGPPLVPPTNPEVGYPIGATQDAPGASVEGFAFTVLGGKDDSGRVTLQIDPREMFKKWCELQTSYPFYNPTTPAADGGAVGGGLVGYGCLPNDGFATSSTGACSLSPADGGVVPVDCGKLRLCLQDRSTCDCTATACTVDLVTSTTHTFDMQQTGDALSGSEVGIPGKTTSGNELHNVHLDLVQMGP
jgi:hypothetical protein